MRKRNICNIVVPLAGKGQRMINAGFKEPKAMINVMGRSILEWSMDSIDVGANSLSFVVRYDHIRDHKIDLWLLARWPQATIFPVSGETQGSMHSCMFATPYLDQSKPLVIFCPDIWFRPKFCPNEGHFYGNDGLILTFKANSKNYSYVSRRPNSNIVEYTREKEVISNEASVGVYCFKNTREWETLAQHIYADAKGTKQELYICPMYNEFILRNKDGVKAQQIEKIYIMGTPEEKLCFEDYIYRFMHPNKEIAICSDHSGYDQKKEVTDILRSWKVVVTDYGHFDDRDSDYNIPVKAVVDDIRLRPNVLGIGCCRTGQGINICANKHKYIRSALVYNKYTAEYAIRHNAANLFSLPNLDKRKLPGILDKLLTATFDGGRHQNRLMQCED
jgi:RpiB/LacA/LacB family sugar-phosphate isomerase